MSLGLGGVRKLLFVLQKRQRNIFRLWTPAGPLPAIHRCRRTFQLSPTDVLVPPSCFLASWAATTGGRVWP